jgi:hypothetical protein
VSIWAVLATAVGFSIWSVLCVIIGYSLAQTKPRPRPDPRLN